MNNKSTISLKKCVYKKAWGGARKMGLFVMLSFFTLSSVSYAQTEKNIISGIVSYEDGAPLPGANVLIKGTTTGASTDFDGKFYIPVKEGQILVFSYVGMKTLEVVYSGQQEINVTLETKPDELDAVTLVAFGKQKKESVIGSVSTINPTELKVPSSNLTTALAGRLAGVVAFQRSGEPGRDNAAFFIRGVTTFGYRNSPLILIDNIELTTTDLARLQPDDIASFSIMKDATATALYGARGANGVILVSTKEGKEGKAKLNVRYEQSLSMPTRSLEIADPITYMRLHNEAIASRNPLGGRLYSLERIKLTEQANRNQFVYPTVDWFGELFEENTFNDRFNFNLSGGGKVARYYVAGTFNADNGILKVDKRNNFNNNIKFKRTSLRSNINIDVTETTELTVRFNANFDDYNGPIDSGADLYGKALKANPVLFPKFFEPDAQFANTQHILFGNAGQFGDYLNPYADSVKGYREERRSLFLASVQLEQDLSFITEGLNLRLLGNTTRESFFNFSNAYNPFFYSVGSYDTELDLYNLNELNEDFGREFLEHSPGNQVVKSSFYGEAALNYNKTFNEKHNVTGLLVGIIREQLIVDKYLIANTEADGKDALPLSLPYRNIGLSGRFTYAYDNRLFSEFNFGYNGSERFAKKERFGFFPSAGLGWMVSNEKFWEPLQDKITKLKLKATYGIVGNDAIGDINDRFFYLSDVSANSGGNSFGIDYNNFISGVGINRYANNQITWEVAKKTNLGIEVGLFNKINIQADVFREYRSNILMDRSEVPSSLGLQSTLRANVGESSSKGFEVAIDYNDSFSNGIWVQARGNFTYATNKFEVVEELDYISNGEPWRSRVGKNLNQPFGLIAERLFIDEADIANSPVQMFNEDYLPGDIKYKDINNDGVIDNKDEVAIGHPTTPEIIYGFGASAGYKELDFSFFFQGSARSSFFIDALNTAPFIDTSPNGIGNNALLQVWADDHWSENNRDLYAQWPRLSDQVEDNNNRRSTWFQKNGAFLRLKSVELGYTIRDKKLLNKGGINSMRIYLSGTNLLNFSAFKLWDIEMGGNGLAYPIQKVFNLGANINF